MGNFMGNAATFIHGVTDVISFKHRLQIGGRCGHCLADREGAL